MDPNVARTEPNGEMIIRDPDMLLAERQREVALKAYEEERRAKNAYIRARRAASRYKSKEVAEKRQQKQEWANSQGKKLRHKYPPIASNFVVKMPARKADAQHAKIARQGDVHKTLFLVDSPEHPSLAFKTACGAIATCTNPHQICTYAGAIIYLMVPSLKGDVKLALEYGACDPIETSPEAVLGMMEMVPNDVKFMSTSHCNLVWAGCVLCLFKNANEKNFDGYMMGRLKALIRNTFGPDIDVKNLPFPIHYTQAKEIRGILGGNRQFGKAVLNFLMSHVEIPSPLQQAISYVHEMLLWGDLYIFKFINETIMMTESPIASSIIIKPEVEKFRQAMALISRCEYPQFARYFAKEHEQPLLRRTHFPMLIHLALRLKESTNGKQVQQFVSTKGFDKQLADKLYADHMKEIGYKETDPDDKALMYLLRSDENSDDEYEEVEESS